MSSSKNKLPVRRQPAVVDIGCGCGRPKLSIFSSSTIPLLKTRTASSPTATTSASLTATSTTTTTSYPSSPSTLSYSEPESSKKRTTSNSVVEESEAVVKLSSEPYHDFRESMLLMIIEKEMYAWEDLLALLHRFLDLNSPQHYDVIFQAWSSLFAHSSKTSAAADTLPPRREIKRC